MACIHLWMLADQHDSGRFAAKAWNSFFAPPVRVRIHVELLLQVGDCADRPGAPPLDRAWAPPNPANQAQLGWISRSIHTHQADAVAGLPPRWTFPQHLAKWDKALIHVPDEAQQEGDYLGASLLPSFPAR